MEWFSKSYSNIHGTTQTIFRQGLHKMKFMSTENFIENCRNGEKTRESGRDYPPTKRGNDIRGPIDKYTTKELYHGRPNYAFRSY